MALAQVPGVAVFGLAVLFYWTMGHLLFPDPASSGRPAAPRPAETSAPLSLGV